MPLKSLPHLPPACSFRRRVFYCLWFLHLSGLGLFPAQPQSGTWQTLNPNAGSPAGRHEGAYVQAGDKFYLLGGRGIKPVQVYDPAGRTWADAPATPIELHHFQAVTFEGLIYVAGAFTGEYPSETPVPNLYIYNPLTRQWLKGPDIPPNRQRGSAGVVVYNQKIYLVGGITNGHNSGYVTWFDEFDPLTNTWRTLADAPRARDHFHAALIGDKLYAAGGRRTSASTDQLFDLTVPEVDVYDFTANQWSTLPNGIPTQRGAPATAVLNGELVLIGGESGTQVGAHRETEALNPTTGTWQRLADLQEGRHGTQAIVNNEAIYVVAGSGQRGGEPELTSQEVFYRSTPTAPGGVALSESWLEGPSEVTYGQVAVNTTQNQTVRLTNSGGNQAIVVSSLTLSGSGEFSYQLPGTLPLVIPVGKSLEVPVSFRPLSEGSRSATLAITHSGSGGSKTIALSGGQTGGGGFSGYYTIRARHSGKVLDVPGASLEDGAALIQYQASLPVSGNQSWLLEATPDGYYFIKARHSGKALDVPAASQADGTRIIQYAPYAQAANQQWKIEPVADGYYKLVARHSGKVLDVAGGSLEDGGQVIQYTDYAATSPNQQWQLESVSATGRLAIADDQLIGGEGERVNLYPNPAGELLTVQLSGPASQVSSTKVTDATGRQYLQNAHRGSGENQLLLPVGSLRPGLYWLQLQMGATNKVIRFSKR